MGGGEGVSVGGKGGTHTHRAVPSASPEGCPFGSGAGGDAMTRPGCVPRMGGTLGGGDIIGTHRGMRFGGGMGVCGWHSGAGVPPPEGRVGAGLHPSAPPPPLNFGGPGVPVATWVRGRWHVPSPDTPKG